MRLPILILTLVLSSCATAPHVVQREMAATQNWRDHNGKTVAISGSLERIDEGFFSDDYPLLTVSFDGAQTATGRLSRNLDGEIHGTWQDKAVEVICTSQRKTKGWVDVRCMVLIGNERTVTLVF